MRVCASVLTTCALGVVPLSATAAAAELAPLQITFPPEILDAGSAQSVLPDSEELFAASQELLQRADLPPTAEAYVQLALVAASQQLTTSDDSATASADGDGLAFPENTPPLTQFILPSVSGDCFGDGLHSVGTAVAIPGPTDIPDPGAASGETAFVFTALGTGPAEPEQEDMRVHWVNLSTLTWGTTTLGYHGVNPEGPATLTGSAPTGNGPIIAVIEGTVHATDTTCSYTPTAALLTPTEG